MKKEVVESLKKQPEKKDHESKAAEKAEKMKNEEKDGMKARRAELRQRRC